MISNVTDSTSTAASAAASSTTQNSNISTVDTPFGQLLVENLGSADAVDVGYVPPAVQIQNEGGTASTSTTPAAAASTPASSTAEAATTGTGTTTVNPNSVPTVESVFGDSPWQTDAGGNGPTGSFTLNPMYFATDQTAQTVASMVGGTVVQVNTFAQTPGTPFTQNEPNEMVQLTDGALINPGLVAGFFTHGYQASMVQQMIQNEVTNVESAVSGSKGVATS